MNARAPVVKGGGVVVRVRAALQPQRELRPLVSEA